MKRDTEWLFVESGLTQKSPQFSEEFVLEKLWDLYRLSGSIEKVDTEKDSTFVLATASSDAGETGDPDIKFLVKISHPSDRYDVIACQSAAVDWIHSLDPSIPVQRPIPSTKGFTSNRLFSSSGEFLGVIRVLHYLPGVPLAEHASEVKQLRHVGESLARMDLALATFRHVGEQRVLVWDLSRFMQLEGLVPLQVDAGHRALAQSVFDAYREHVLPGLHGSRKQVIHGDFSPYNVLVDPANDHYVQGIIDFGDMVRGPLVFEPAVLLGNSLTSDLSSAWRSGRELLKGFQKITPLSPEEIRMVVVASIARVTLRAVVTNWRLSRSAERADYLTKHSRDDWNRIEASMTFGIEEAVQFLETARTS